MRAEDRGRCARGMLLELITRVSDPMVFNALVGRHYFFLLSCRALKASTMHCSSDFLYEVKFLVVARSDSRYSSKTAETEAAKVICKLKFVKILPPWFCHKKDCILLKIPLSIGGIQTPTKTE